MRPQNHLRVVAFAGVLLIVSGLIFGIFQEANAVTFEFVSPPTTIGGSTVIVADLVVEMGKRIPIESIDVVVERQNTVEPSKLAAIPIARASCPMSPSGGMDCNANAGLQHVQGQAGVVRRIAFVGAFAGTAQAGNEITQTGTEGYFGPGPRDVITTGYGYDNFTQAYLDLGFGYGYGYKDPGGRVGVDFGYGNGYGYTADDLVLRFEITLSSLQLQIGRTHYVTVLAVTGDSSILKEFSTPFHTFTPLGGGGGGGGGDLPTSATPAEGRPFSIAEGGEVTITEGLPEGLTELVLIFDQDCVGCRVVVEEKPCSELTNRVPGGYRAITCYDIRILDQNNQEVDDFVRNGRMRLAFDADNLEPGEGPRQVGVMRVRDGVWTPVTMRITSEPTANPILYEATLPGFSVFALAVDVQPPTLSDMEPVGAIQVVTPMLRATWGDNRGIDADSFELTVDGDVHDATTGDLVASATGFTYVPGVAFLLGEHTVSATIEDVSGLSTTQTWTFTITTPECPVPPEILSVRPADGATGVAVASTVEVTLQEGSCPITTSTLTVNGRSVTATLAGLRLTATLPDSVAGGETVEARVVVEDSSGNTASRSWSFETAQEGPPEGPPEDGGVPGWVWVLIILVVLAAIAGVVYYVMQQQGGGGTGGTGGGGTGGTGGGGAGGGGTGGSGGDGGAGGPPG